MLRGQEEPGPSWGGPAGDRVSLFYTASLGWFVCKYVCVCLRVRVCPWEGTESELLLENYSAVVSLLNPQIKKWLAKHPPFFHTRLIPRKNTYLYITACASTHMALRCLQQLPLSGGLLQWTKRSHLKLMFTPESPAYRPQVGIWHVDDFAEILRNWLFP